MERSVNGVHSWSAVFFFMVDDMFDGIGQTSGSGKL